MPEEEKQAIENPSGGNGGSGKTMECKECGSVHYATGDFDLKKVSGQRKNERKKFDELDAANAEIEKLKKEVANRDERITALQDELRDKKVSGGAARHTPFYLRKGA